MTCVVEAVFSGGVFRPDEEIDIPEDRRVRLIVEDLPDQPANDRRAAIVELLAGIERMNFRSTGPYPSRDELHERR